MGRPKRYASEAEKQAAYRLRKKSILVEKEAVADDRNLGTDGDLPVPVLAEPKPGKYLLGASIGVGEARESTNLAKAVRADSQRRAKLFDGKRNRDSAELQCDNCGTSYWARTEDKERSRFCGKTCQASTMARESMGISREIQKKAYHEVESAISIGILVPRPCEKCGKVEVDAHHEDYSKPLEVIWLCRSHHVQRHMPIRGGQTLSSTDRKFEEDRPNWYIFGKVEREINCWRCGKKYTTRLEMSRFCSPTCKTIYLDSASHLREIK